MPMGTRKHRSHAVGKTALPKPECLALRPGRARVGIYGLTEDDSTGGLALQMPCRCGERRQRCCGTTEEPDTSSGRRSSQHRAS